MVVQYSETVPEPAEATWRSRVTMETVGPWEVLDLKVEKAIIDRARNLFDVAGITSHSGESLLILGLLTTPQRDLDDFFREEPGSFRVRGFELHALPKLDALIRFIQEQGLAAEFWGRCGYPKGRELNLKQQAVIAGLGKWRPVTFAW